MDQAILEQAKAELSKCKTQFLKSPVGRGIAAAVYSLEWEFEDCRTAYTTGTKVVIDPEFFMSLKGDGALSQRCWVIAHEVWHVLLKHIVRMQAYEPEDWDALNTAADHVINLKLEDDGFDVPDEYTPVGGDPFPCPKDRKYKDWSMEKVFEDLQQNKSKDQQQQNPMADCQQGSNGTDDQPQKMDPATLKELENRLNNVIAKTYQSNKQSNNSWGDNIGDMDRILDEILNPKIPWQTLLHKFMIERFPDDYSWARPNINYMPDFYVPSVDGEGMGNLGLYVDASGSVSDEDFAEFKGQMSQIIRTLNPQKTLVAEFDTKLRKPTELLQGQSLANVKFTGYGGTNIVETMDHIHKTPMEVAVIFTDGYFSEYVPEGFCTPIIWVIKGRYEKNFAYPTGDIIYMDD